MEFGRFSTRLGTMVRSAAAYDAASSRSSWTYPSAWIVWGSFSRHEAPPLPSSARSNAARPLSAWQAAENGSPHRPAAPDDEDAVGAFHKVNFVVAGSWRYQPSARLLALVNNRFAVLKKNLGLRRSGVMP